MKTSIFLLFLGFGLASYAGGTVAQVNHSSWDQLLQKHVSANGNVDYSGFKADQAKLNTYLKTLAANHPTSSWSKNEEMAYWINAYNAFTIDLVVRNYPVKSIMDINKGKPWDLAFIKLGGKTYTLNQIEHEILRPKFKDARVHFAVNCASISCPKLYNRAIEATELNKQLDLLAKGFINNSAKNSITSNKIGISKIFEWFKDDFTKDGSLISFLNKYTATKIDAGAKVSYKEYNWNLNK